MAFAVVEFSNGDVDIVEKDSLRGYASEADHPVACICDWPQQSGSKRTMAYAVKVYRCG